MSELIQMLAILRYIAQRKIDDEKARLIAERYKLPKEKIESIDAIVFVSDRGEISWIDKRKPIIQL